MSLDSVTPKLDDRSYQDLISEIRARIPSYTPEWTDLNDNEPGMAIVQTFAHIADQLLYRMNRIPEINEIRFLELLGIDLRAAAAASVELTFPIRPTHPEPSVVVPHRTRVSGQGESGSVVFETRRTLVCLSAPLVSVHGDNGGGLYDVSAINAVPGAGFYPFGHSPAVGHTLTLGFDYPDASPLSAAKLPPGVETTLPEIELDLAFWIQGAGQGGTGTYTACAQLALRSRPPATLVWEGWDGASWVRLRTLRDDTLGLTQSGHILLGLPKAGVLKRGPITGSAVSRFYLRARLENVAYERVPRLLAIRTNTTLAEAAQTVENEILGGSDGSPDQSFTLAHAPVVAGSLTLTVDEGTSAGEVAWQESEDYFAASPTDTAYFLDRASGEVRFGNGRFGRIPIANPANPGGSLVARLYRWGGGKSGNLAAGKVNTLMASVPGVDEAKVANLLAAAGGTDEETLGEAKARARANLRSRSRAVTAEDYEQLALQSGLIRRAKALPLFHPAYPDVRVPGAITVMVVPDSDDDAPMPQEPLRRAVCACLAAARTLGAELFVAAPVYQRVAVTVDVIADNEADLAAVQDAIGTALYTYFHPLQGGDSGTGWPFGEKIFYSRVYQRLSALPGVQAIEQLLIRVDGQDQRRCHDVALAPNALTYSHRAEHVVRADYRYDEDV